MKKSAHVVLHENIRNEMTKRHLSDADVAHRSGLSLTTVKQITGAPEGAQHFNLDRLERFAAAFGLNTAQLLVDARHAKAAPLSAAGAPAGSPGRPPSLARDATPKMLVQLIEEFFILPEADRQVLLRTASDMASKYRSQILR